MTNPVEGASGEVPSLPEGQVLAGRYELLGMLGIGGMGCVYRARDRELDEQVALKMLRPELVANPVMLGRFRQEVKLARRVTHTNVARTFDIGEHEGQKFLTMELVEGESLGALLGRERRLSIARVVEVVEATCAGLSAAHAAGVVHRDLKPDNVLIAKYGRIVITDFGIARAFDVDAKMTHGGPVGTPAYMAPEQVEGKQDIDARADIYALGAMAFELLTGVLAWEGESAYAVAAMRLVRPPPDPRAKRDDIPDAIGRVVMRCMARAREDRYATAMEAAAAFGSITLPASVPVARASSPARLGFPAPMQDTGASGLKSVAVLPFRNGGAEDDYLADGLTEDLIDTLSMGKGLRVRSRGAVMRFKGVDRDPREVGRELAVQVVVEGSVRRSGERLRVSVRLVSVADGFQLYAKRFDCAAGEVLAIGDQAANAIAEALTLSWQAPARDAPTDPAAIDLYLRARHEYHKGFTDSTKVAVDLFRQALVHAPSDPTIASGLAMALARRFAFDLDADGFVDEALACADRALAVAPHLGEARVALGTLRLYLGESVAAATEVRRATSTSPGLADGHDLFGRMLIDAGRPEEGIVRLQTAMTLEPALMHSHWDVARAYALLGELAKCDTYFERVPEDAAAANLHWINRARIALWRRDLVKAQGYLDRLDLVPEAMRGAVGMICQLCVTGHLVEMGRVQLDTLATQGRSMRRRAFFRQMLAECLAYAGDEEGMISALDDSERAASFDVFSADRHPLFAPYRKNPRFVAIRDRLAGNAEQVLRALLTPSR